MKTTNQKKVNINDLYFGVKVMDFNDKEMRTINLFQTSRVKQSVAIYRTMDDESRKRLSSGLNFCFGDVWARAEYEWLVSPWPSGADGDGPVQKVDVYRMYVEPNADYLMSLVESVSESSAKKYLSEVRKARRGRR